jgi:hypothetical protein
MRQTGVKKKMFEYFPPRPKAQNRGKESPRVPRHAAALPSGKTRRAAHGPDPDFV